MWGYVDCTPFVIFEWNGLPMGGQGGPCGLPANRPTCDRNCPQPCPYIDDILSSLWKHMLEPDTSSVL